MIDMSTWANDAFRDTSVYDNCHQVEYYQNMEEPNYESKFLTIC